MIYTNPSRRRLAKSLLRYYSGGQSSIQSSGHSVGHASDQPNEHGVIFEPLAMDPGTKKPLHVPVMQREVLQIINPQAGQVCAGVLA